MVVGDTERPFRRDPTTANILNHGSEYSSAWESSWSALGRLFGIINSEIESIKSTIASLKGLR